MKPEVFNMEQIRAKFPARHETDSKDEVKRFLGVMSNLRAQTT